MTLYMTENAEAQGVSLSCPRSKNMGSWAAESMLSITNAPGREGLPALLSLTSPKIQVQILMEVLLAHPAHNEMDPWFVWI